MYEPAGTWIEQTDMNSKAKKRLIISTLAIIVIAIVMVAFAGAGGAAKSLTLAQALSGDYTNQRVQVEGTVVDNSYSTVGTTTTFKIYDPAVGPAQALEVHYMGALSATFGGGIVAICTGTLSEEGTLTATELVTKCPSKYESAEGAVTVAQLVRSAESLSGTELKLAGYIKPGTLEGPGSSVRFIIYSQDSELPVVYTGALPEGCGDGSAVVLIGVLELGTGGQGVPGRFIATEVALERIG